MKCPHCRVDAPAPVSETRKSEGSIHRRRKCSNCGESYLTEETAAESLAMPQRKRTSTSRPERRAMKAKNLALFKVWS